jgi:hypothetical protein
MHLKKNLNTKVEEQKKSNGVMRFRNLALSLHPLVKRNCLFVIKKLKNDFEGRSVSFKNLH